MAVGSGRIIRLRKEVGDKPLSKSQKRNRRKYLARKGREQIATTTPGPSAGAKRTLKELSSPSPTSKGTPAKKPREDFPPRSYRQVVSGWKMAIIKEGFPSEKLNSADERTIQCEIIRSTDSLSDKEPLPHLSSSGLCKGVFVAQCDDQQTVEWLTKTFHMNDKIIENTLLKVIKASELPKPVKVAFKCKDVLTTDPKALLKRLNRFNPKLKTSDWRVLGKRLEPQSSRWIFEVDLEAAQAIQEANCMAYSGLDMGIFKILSKPKEPNKDGEDDNIKEDSAGQSDIITTPAEDTNTIPEVEMEVGETQPGTSSEDQVSTESDSVYLRLSPLNLSDDDSEITVCSLTPETMKEVECLLEPPSETDDKDT